MTATTFGEELRRQRARQRISQSRLALEAGFDHSYVSRIESGTRKPTREAVLALADALRAAPQERDRLLIAAGFMPDDPGVREIVTALVNGEVLSVFRSEPVEGVDRVLASEAAAGC